MSLPNPFKFSNKVLLKIKSLKKKKKKKIPSVVPALSLPLAVYALTKQWKLHQHENNILKRRLGE